MIKVKKLMKDLNLACIAGEGGLNNKVEVSNYTRPGLEFAGYFEFSEAGRIFLLGSKENSFLKTLNPELGYMRFKQTLEVKPPCIICSKNVELPDYAIELGNKYNVPILKSDSRTVMMSAKLYNYLQEALAPVQTVHGVLLDINGMGTLIVGKSGIGKSETALELVKRGHQLVSDDRVDIIEKEPGLIIGKAPKVLERYSELRGIGIIDVQAMYGAGAFRDSKKIRLVVELENWDDNKYYDRLGLERETITFFNTKLTKVVIPILPGRNLALLIEAAALNEKLKYMGLDSAKEFTSKINKLAERGSDDDEDDII